MCGVPQGSLFGPLLIKLGVVSYHMNADDTAFYSTTSASYISTDRILKSIEAELDRYEPTGRLP